MLGLCFFFKQKTAYEMRISDWSSDVCSSDLLLGAQRSLLGEAEGDDAAGEAVRHGHHPGIVRVQHRGAVFRQAGDDLGLFLGDRLDRMERLEEIGRASCRERVCQYV